MFLLRFTVKNHGSFRDQAELTLVSSRLRTSTPPDGKRWADYVGSVAAIYGANASGKSQFLGAFDYFRNFIRTSATELPSNKRLPRRYFRLDEISRDAPSEYIVDFVHDDVRYEYGFTVATRRVLEEWLYSYPTGRKRVLFDRNGKDLAFGRALKGGEARIKDSLDDRELVLSRGALLRYPQLAEIADLIVDGIEFARFGENSRHDRLTNLMRDVAESRLELDDLRTMLRVADVGIAGADLTSHEADEETRKFLRQIFELTNINGDDDEFEQMVQDTGRGLMFEHVGAGETSYKLPTQLQSSGTLTWLSLAVPAVATIKRGGVFVVDELDSSLHPQLAQVMIQMFRNPETNPKHAQLVFTTHDTYFLSSRARVTLQPDEVFFVEKDRTGASSIFSLADFPARRDQNYAHRYLEGRYGAIPTVAPAFLADIVSPGEADHASDPVAAQGNK